MFSPPANQSNQMPPSPDRLELKERLYNYTLEPPSPGRLALKGIETDDEITKHSNDEPDQDQLTTPPAELEEDNNEEKNQIEQPKGMKPNHAYFYLIMLLL